MDEWLKPEPLDENGLNIRRIVGGSRPADKNPQGRDGAKSRPPCNYGRRRPNSLLGQQDGRVVKARVFFAENGLNIRRIVGGWSPADKNSTGEGWSQVTSPCNCGRRKPNGFRAAGWPSG
jgi:hypothetical protein